ncbi:hypothetical protein DFS33DRAFT_1490524 [Desarmillaria ectypa]|nr:hypothetical protein DFS33DRAFT_1490524 [Desarmillaria ectypa]
MIHTPSKTIGRSLIEPSWKDMRPIFSIARTTKDSSPDVAPDLDQNTNVVAPSESQEAVIDMNGSSTAEGGGPILEATPDMSSDLSKIEEILGSSGVGPLAFPLAGPMTRRSSCRTADDFDMRLERSYDIIRILLRTSYEVTISAFTETGQAESSIKVPKQRAYTGRRPVIPSSIADTPCADLGLQGILDQLNIILETSYSLDTPSISSVLEDCISNNYDFGTAYGRLRYVWRKVKYSTVQDQLRIREKKDQKRRREALVGNRIVNPYLQPRRVWDLYSNRVVPSWTSEHQIMPISHAWMDVKDRVNVKTPINGKEWPTPIPIDANLDLIRIEMLNLGLEYTWLDVLCLRQDGGPSEDLRKEEWKLDVPTIGQVYRWNDVVTYLSGLGRPLSLKEGDLDSDQSWFRRAWTVQEVGICNMIIAGDTPDGLMHAKPIDKDGNYDSEILTRFHKQLKSVRRVRSLLGALTDMQNRLSTNPVDKVAGLAFPLDAQTIPVYHESESLENAWTALVNAIHPFMRGCFLFLYPDAGQGLRKWRPTWDQVMMKPLPADDSCSEWVDHDDKTDEDWYEGWSIENGFVQGLGAGSEEGVDRCGELVVEDKDGIQYVFRITATHMYLIHEGMYTLLTGKGRGFFRLVVGQQLSEQRFEKVSVVAMTYSDKKRLIDLGIPVQSHNILV